jgi:two-component system phosphate regulon sensor histidine kinase PhoR
MVAAAAVVIAVATLTLDFAVRRSWDASLRRQITVSLTQKVKLFAHHIGDVTKPDLPGDVAVEAQAADARATVIDSTGKVLADSEAHPSEMENHATRPEFVAALHGNIGSNIRRSHTLGIEFLYVAAPIKGGAVRLAYPLAEIEETLGEVRKTLLMASMAAFAAAVILASLAAQIIARRLRRIMQFAERISAGDLASRISDPSSDEIGHLAAALDKTARRLEQMFATAESNRKELETLLNTIEDAVIAISREGKVLWVNRALGTVLPQLRLRDSFLEMIRDPEVLQCLEKVRGSAEACKCKAMAVAPGRAFQCTVAPMPNGAAVIVLHDLTEVERVERTRRDFIANVSHELRTPLTSIEGYTETLLEVPELADDDQRREFLQTIKRNAQRMSRLTEDLLKLARVESGEWRLEKENISAAAVLQQALTNFRTIATAHELRIEQSSDEEILADADAIQQVFANLIENAAKYSPAGTPIVLGARKREDEVEFYVKDFGPGIATHHLPRLFERFYRVDKARSREAGGTGLGLAIVKHIVLNHGGSVRVESVVGQGSTFVFSVPCVVTPILAAH